MLGYIFQSFPLLLGESKYPGPKTPTSMDLMASFYSTADTAPMIVSRCP